VGDIWFTSDTHFGHANFLKFMNDAGERIRPFASVEEMDEHMVERWNARVRPGDKVYHLGDVCFGDAAILARLNGSKRLILGNHDNIKDATLYAAFKKIQLWRFFKDDGFVCTHIPLALGDLRKATFNVHGHIHDKPAPTPQHLCICVEQTDYTPVHMDEIRAALVTRKDTP
jgi:calcineurin-like phosphoesterase family protein